MFKVFQPVIVRIERLSIFVAAGGSTSGELVPAYPKSDHKEIALAADLWQ